MRWRKNRNVKPEIVLGGCTIHEGYHLSREDDDMVRTIRLNSLSRSQSIDGSIMIIYGCIKLHFVY